MSRTPQFDAALDVVLKDLKPHERACKECGVQFRIYEEDIDFLYKLRVPPPKKCPACRMQRLLGCRLSLLPIFYKKTCAAPSHSEKVVSLYAEDNKRVTIYDYDYWWSDTWNPLDFGAPYNFQENFFSQFSKFSQKVPRQPLQRDPTSVNSEYTISGKSAKNCYYAGGCYLSEDICYGVTVVRSKQCVLVNTVERLEQGYSCVHTSRSYNCRFAYDSRDSVNCSFIFDCRNSSDCFGCTNLRNKQYCFFNEQLTKSEYEEKVRSINLGSRKALREYEKKFDVLFHSAIHRAVNNMKTEKSTGNDLKGCKNCFHSFFVLDSENVRYGAYADRIKDVLGVFGAGDCSLICESTSLASSTAIKFSNWVRNGLELEYCVELNSSEYCFGCIGLRNKKYCVLNKQYSESEYWPLIDRIKTEMLSRGEYGEFFPLSVSVQPYNNSNAMIEFPLSKEKVLNHGWFWQDEPESDIDLSTKLEVVKGEDLPDDIRDVSDDIVKKAVICERTGKPFRIVRAELDFYRQHNLPLPTIHPLLLIKDLLKFRHPFRLFRSSCAKCGTEVDTFYDPAKDLKIYCEECYLREVV